MKWIGLITMLAAVYPLGRAAAKDPRIQRWLAIAVGFLPFHLIALNIVSFENYRGDSRGLELTLVDFLCWSLLISLPPASRPSPMRALRWLYFGIAAISMFRAEIPLYASFGLFRLLRLYILFYVCVRALRDAKLAEPLLQGLGLGVIYASGLCLWQRYGLGFLQAPGPFSHQNSLAMAVNMVTPSYFATVLNGKGGRFGIAVLAAGALAVLLTLSRGGMAMLVIACAVVFIGSTVRRPTSRKFKMLALALVGLSLVLLKAYDTIVDRFVNAPKSSEEARELFEEAATEMLHDRPFGVGLNMFSHALDTGGYGERVGLPEGDRSGIVHNLYYLTAAELGWVGLGAFLLVVGAPLFWAARAAWRRPGFSGELALGVMASIGVTLLQGKLEWALRITQLSQLLWILFAFAAALDTPGTARAPTRDASAPRSTPKRSSRFGTKRTKRAGAAGVREGAPPREGL